MLLIVVLNVSAYSQNRNTHATGIARTLSGCAIVTNKSRLNKFIKLDLSVSSKWNTLHLPISSIHKCTWAPRRSPPPLSPGPPKIKTSRSCHRPSSMHARNTKFRTSHHKSQHPGGPPSTCILILLVDPNQTRPGYAKKDRITACAEELAHAPLEPFRTEHEKHSLSSQVYFCSHLNPSRNLSDGTGGGSHWWFPVGGEVWDNSTRVTEFLSDPPTSSGSRPLAEFPWTPRLAHN